MRIMQRLFMLIWTGLFSLTKWVLALVLSGAASIAAAQVLPDLPLPVLPNEMHALSKNGCGFVTTLPTVNEQTVKEARLSLSTAVWSGDCTNGLATGYGTLLPPQKFDEWKDYRTEFSYGRILPKMSTPNLTTKSNDVTYNLGGRVVSVPSVGDPFAPKWKSELFDATYVADPDNASVFITTFKSSCFINQPAFNDCSIQNEYEVFGFTLKRESGNEEMIWCPNPRTTSGCEALWRQKGSPIFSKIQAIIDQTEEKIVIAKRFFRNMTEPWIAQVAGRKLAQQADLRRQAEISTPPRTALPQDPLAVDLLLECSHETSMLHRRLRKESGPGLSDTRARSQIMRQVETVLNEPDVHSVRPKIIGYTNELTGEAMSVPDEIVGVLFGLCIHQRRAAQLSGAVRVPPELRVR
jgi:hypothetical protein